MTYEAPGRVRDLGDELGGRWNAEVRRAYERQRKLHTRFFVLDPGELVEPAVTSGVTWPANPLEPTFCEDDATVRALCDWLPRARNALHSEYCEYAVVHREDGDGRMRPKRVQVTTELAEYWLTLAVHSPARLRAEAADVLGEEPAWAQLYGVADPEALDEEERRLRFAIAMAGHGGDAELERAGVPRDPQGRLNTENAVFMTHPINGLNDLLYIALFGARPYAVKGRGEFPGRATSNDIFAAAKVPHLACRHADPAAAAAAYGAVLGSRALSFANPLGMYLRSFNDEPLQVGGEPIPPEWVRWGRGREGMHQRLELGPGDEDDAFLDDIEVAVGNERQRLAGGYQLLKLLEVGPLLATGKTEPADRAELVEIPVAGPIECSRTDICRTVAELKAERERA